MNLPLAVYRHVPNACGSLGETRACSLLGVPLRAGGQPRSQSLVCPKAHAISSYVSLAIYLVRLSTRGSQAGSQSLVFGQAAIWIAGAPVCCQTGVLKSSAVQLSLIRSPDVLTYLEKRGLGPSELPGWQPTPVTCFDDHRVLALS